MFGGLEKISIFAEIIVVFLFSQYWCKWVKISN